MPTCTECDDSAVARGYCNKHWKRWRKHGDPSVVLYGGGGARKYTLNQKYFDEITTPEQAYWLGFFTADGCVVRNKKTYQLRLQLAEKDRTHVQRFVDTLGSNQPVWILDGCAGISLNSRPLVEALGRLGVHPRKSLTAEAWDGPENLMPHYWRGLFDGDGTIFKAGSSSKYWCMGICGSVACVESFAGWARGITGSRATVRLTGKNSKCWFWVVQGNKITIPLAEALYSPGAVALERKRVLADAICDGG